MSKIIIDAPQAKKAKVPVDRVGKFTAILSACTHAHYSTSRTCIFIVQMKTPILET